MTRKWAVFAAVLAASLASKLSLREFRNKSYAAKIHAYLPLCWSFGQPGDPRLEGIAREIESRLPASAPGPRAEGVGPVRERANVLLLIVESLRADAVAPGIAPFLDSLGREGLAFRNHFSTANCTPFSVFSLLTGEWPSVYRSYLGGGGKPACYQMFPGYDFYTGNAVTWSFWDQDRDLFRDFRTIDARSPGAREATDSGLIGNFFRTLGPRTARPFFAALMLNSTHFGYAVDPGRIVRPGYYRDTFGMRTADPAAMPAIKDRYLNSVHLADAMVRMAFRKLDSLGLSRTTLVAVVGDHGEEFLETGKFTHSSEVNRYQTHVPMIVSYRGWKRSYAGYSSHAQAPALLSRLLSGGDPETILAGIGASLRPAALAFNSVPLPDDADEFGAIGDDFELRMRWDRSRLEVYDARFTGRRTRPGAAELDAIAEAIGRARKGG